MYCRRYNRLCYWLYWYKRRTGVCYNYRNSCNKALQLHGFDKCTIKISPQRTSPMKVKRTGNALTKPALFQKRKSDSIVAFVSPSQTILSSQIRVCRSSSSNRNVLVHHQGFEPWTPRLGKSQVSASWANGAHRFKLYLQRLPSNNIDSITLGMLCQ